ncbi:PAS domain S-box protein [Pyxidicoccus caerfyrddinensis]|uniref:PAS domain S-box protein n=1 Tax=Pyxidicoccus caerfyrddinensis TaxID=2709663 RepID=UPI0013D9052E|nr:PAS domain S-box protein [Pyxidicoccus caerfyrddinensis]
MREKVLLPRLGAEDGACLRSALTVLGREPVEVETAEQAATLLREESFGLLVLDTEAEDSAAWTRSVQRAMRERGGPALLLLVSSERPEGRLLTEALSGTLAYAVRPLSRDAVVRTLRSLLEQGPERRDDAEASLASEWKAELRREREVRATVEGRLRELLRSEQRLHALLEATTSVMWTLTPEGSAVEPSVSWEAFTGKTFAEYRGHGYMNLIHPEDREGVWKDWAQVLRRPTPYSSEYRLLRHDERWRRMLSRGVPVLGPDGRVREWVGWLVDITEQRKHELALRESEEQFRAFFNLAAAGMAQVDPVAGRLLVVNAKLCEVTGYSAQELVGMNYIDLVHPEERPQGSAGLARLVGGDAIPAINARRWVRKDGGDMWVEIAATLLRDESGRPLRVLAVVQDVTARKHAELERGRLVSVVESSPDVICIHDVDGRALYINEAGRGLLGLESLAEVQGLSVLDTVHPDDRRIIEQEVFPAIEREGRWVGDLRAVNLRTGKAIPVFTQYFLVRDSESGQKTGLGCISRDITERKRSEERLTFLTRASRLLASSLADETTLLMRVAELAASSVATCCMVSLIQPEGTPRWLEVAHRDPSRASHVQQALREAPTPAWTALFDALSTSGQAVLVDIRETRALGPMHRALLEAMEAVSVLAVALTSRGHVLGIIVFASGDPDRLYGDEDRGMAEELAYRAAAAVDIARLYAQAQRAIRLRDEFLSIASHELKTPLTPLALKLQGMKRTLPVESLGDSAERMRADLELAQRQVRRLAELVDGLLDVSRIRAGRLQLELELVDLSALVRELVERYEPQAQRAQSRIFLEADPSILGRWDRSRLEQVVSNLLSNALKYGAGRPVHVRVSASGGTARLEVRDEGIGIEPQSLHRIFQRFERAVSERHYGGLGLGLYITRQIVEAHGGCVRAESAPGQGATFTVTLPLEGPSEVESPCDDVPEEPAS